MATVGTLAVELSANTRDFKRDINDAKADMQGFGDKSTSSLNKVAEKLLAIGATIGVLAIGQDAIQTAIDFETAWVGVEKVIDASDKELDELRGTLREMATDKDNPLSSLEGSFLTLAGIAEIGGQLGIAADDLEEFVQVVGELTMATNLSGDEAATFIGKFSAITGLPVSQYREFGDAIVTLGNNFAVTEDQLAKWGLRLAPLSSFDWDADEILAYGAAMEVVGITPELGGTNLIKTVTDFTTAIALGGPQLERYASAAGLTVDELKALEESDPQAAFNAVIEGLSKMPIDDQLQAMQELGITGTEQQGVMLRLAGSYDNVLTPALEDAEEAFQGNNALMEEAGKKADTAQGKINTFNNKLEEFKAKIGEIALPFLTDLLDGLNNGIEAWENNFAMMPQVMKVILDEIGRDWELFLLDIEMRMGIWLTDIENKLRGTPFEVDFGINELGTMDRIADLEIVDFLQRQIQNQVKSGGGLDLTEMLNFTASSGVSFAGDLGFLLDVAIDQDNVSESMKGTLESAARYAIETGDFETAEIILEASVDLDLPNMMELIEELETASGTKSALAPSVDVAPTIADEENTKNVLIDSIERLGFEPSVIATTTTELDWANADDFVNDVSKEIQSQDYATTVTVPVTMEVQVTNPGAVKDLMMSSKSGSGNSTTVNMNVEGSVVTEQELIDTVAEGIEKGGG